MQRTGGADPRCWMKEGFWPLQRTPLSPTVVSARLFQRAKMIRILIQIFRIRYLVVSWREGFWREGNRLCLNLEFQR